MMRCCADLPGRVAQGCFNLQQRSPSSCALRCGRLIHLAPFRRHREEGDNSNMEGS